MTDRQNDSKKTQLTYLGSDRKALYFHDEGSRAYWESALFFFILVKVLKYGAH